MLKRIRRSLTLKWMIFSIFLATIPLTVGGFNIIKIYQRNLKKSVIATEEMKAGIVAGRTAAFFDKITSNLLTLVDDEELKMGGHSSRVRNLLENFLSQNDYLWELALLNEKGNETIKISKYKVIAPREFKNQAKSEMFGIASKGKIYY